MLLAAERTDLRIQGIVSWLRQTTCELAGAGRIDPGQRSLDVDVGEKRERPEWIAAHRHHLEIRAPLSTIPRRRGRYRHKGIKLGLVSASLQRSVTRGGEQ